VGGRSKITSFAGLRSIRQPGGHSLSCCWNSDGISGRLDNSDITSEAHFSDVSYARPNAAKVVGGRRVVSLHSPGSRIIFMEPRLARQFGSIVTSSSRFVVPYQIKAVPSSLAITYCSSKAQQTLAPDLGWACFHIIDMTFDCGLQGGAPNASAQISTVDIATGLPF
jgi:hypothetical protein